MSKRIAAMTILAASFLTVGCSNTDGPAATATGPTSLQLAGSAFASINPSFVSAQLIGRSACPELQPLRVTPNLVVQSDGVTLFLNEVRMRFTDRAGLSGPQVTLPAPMLTVQFGTALIQARSSRRFPLDFSFGCGTDRTGTLTVYVRARDGRGRDRSAEIRVSVH